MLRQYLKFMNIKISILHIKRYHIFAVKYYLRFRSLNGDISGTNTKRENCFYSPFMNSTILSNPLFPDVNDKT